MLGKEVKKVSFYTLGCKLNFAETATISRKFTDNGYDKVEFGDRSDVIVINTCSVTQLADKKCRQAISKAARNSPNAIVAVIGCYSQLKPDEISHIEGVDIVLGTKEKFDILDYVHEYEKQASPNTIVHSCEIDQAEEFNPSFSMFERTRSFLKIQDGCDYNCSYCTIPLARGISRNTTIEKTIAEARKIASQGIKEIVLTGVNIGDFGKSTNETFTELVHQLDEVEGIERFRISSIEPNLLTNEIIEFVARSKRFVPHFHIPLQSGCNEILGLMKRRYTRELFANRIKAIKAVMPEACIGADVIVGFPGESDERFNDTYTFIESLDLSYLHVFSYSERKDTKAILLPQKVNPKQKDLRSQQLIQLSDKKRHLFYQQHIGNTATVLFESEQTEGMMHGFTSNYIKVEAPFDHRKINQTIDIKLMQIMPSGDVAIEYI
ncbi:MAG TPA: tRNA (N(6)-L-threonylcarbamoyladenosine(37)-C(2))-methylthiotransferase MtaB [Bacteroidales bacterium]|nr:tRNA (N(6)-L-threonylcarbamoyladenosine(37)-C(2))-methylthiotransferase MtaB [Bacteroidales bacterium]